MSGTHAPYSLREDKAILKFIMDEHYETVIKGNTLWMAMEKENICPGRTWQSMKNRFKRNILNDLSRPELGVPADIKTLLRSVMRGEGDPVIKRNSDIRLLRLMQEVSNESGETVKANGHADLGNGGGQTSADKTNKTKTSPTELSGSIKKVNYEALGLSPKTKKFYSLDMEWSDSD